MRRAALALVLAALCSTATAQRSHPQAQAPAPAPAAAPSQDAPSQAEPQRTTATFGDWTVRCVRPDKAAQLCEVTQTLYDKSQPVAQTALGRPARGEKMRLTVLVPANVTLATPPRLQGEETDAPLELTWRRCLRAGCLADATLSEDQLRRLRARTATSRIAFQDGAGRDAAIPFAPRGLTQALDALAKEDAH